MKVQIDLVNIDKEGLTKGLLIPKGPFWCHRLDQKTNETVLRISALASKKRSNQKSSVRESK